MYHIIIIIIIVIITIIIVFILATNQATHCNTKHDVTPDNIQEFLKLRAVSRLRQEVQEKRRRQEILKAEMLRKLFGTKTDRKSDKTDHHDNAEKSLI